ncbi:hypothetical protein PDESU_05111 [Pontiella desulfatans]|uniref:Uncharacterized protein n=1 Tax=Pontiella desulfatans TaxID=2750659 RepID=A0A6C2U8Y5_PONDE|nr:hypothetical protein PDESU_05111 [Pontiella desulfatans]
MTALRERTIQTLRLGHYSERAIKTYINGLARLANTTATIARNLPPSASAAAPPEPTGPAPWKEMLIISWRRGLALHTIPIDRPDVPGWLSPTSRWHLLGALISSCSLTCFSREDVWGSRRDKILIVGIA